VGLKEGKSKSEQRRTQGDGGREIGTAEHGNNVIIILRELKPQRWTLRKKVRQMRGFCRVFWGDTTGGIKKTGKKNIFSVGGAHLGKREGTIPGDGPVLEVLFQWSVGWVEKTPGRIGRTDERGGEGARPLCDP